MKTCSYVVLLIIILTVSLIHGEDNPYTTLEKAKTELKNHSYARALELYLQFDKQKPGNQGAREDILNCLSNLYRYDDYLEYAEKFISEANTDLARADFLWLRSNYYLFRIGHYGYKQEGKIYRNPKVAGGEYVYTYKEDYLAGGSDLKNTVSYYRKSLTQSENADVRKKLVNSLLGLAQYWIGVKLEWGWDGKKLTPEEFKKVQDEAIETSLNEASNEAARLNLEYQTLTVFKYMSYRYFKISSLPRSTEQEIAEYNRRIDGLIKDIEGYEAKYKTTTRYVDFLLFRAMILDGKLEYDKSLAIYEQVIKDFPKTFAAKLSAYRIYEITREEVYISTPGPVLPEFGITFNLSSRNVNVVEYAIYECDLKKLFSSLPESSKESKYLMNAYENAEGLKAFYGKEVAKGKWDIAPKNIHISEGSTKNFAIKESGAYLIEVKSGKVKTVALALLTNLGLSVIKGNYSLALYTANAMNGKPMSGVRVDLAYNYYRYSDYKYTTHYTSFTTGDEGFRLASPPEVTNREYLNSMSALAYDGKDYALIGQQYWYLSKYYTKTQEVYPTAYVYTDRPLYRPGQKVYFRAILRQKKGEDWLPLADKEYKVYIVSSRNATLYEKVLKSDIHGIIFGDLELKPDANLGQYRIYLSPQPNSVYLSNNTQYFRVEEYKKPEFVVNVEPEVKQYEIGKTIKFKIKADYYFGGAVKEGTATYQLISRNYKFASYYYGWWWRPFSYESDMYSANGVLKLNEKGEAEVEYNTDADAKAIGQDNNLWGRTYILKVTIVDKSRRTIAAEGDLLATKTHVFPIIDTDRYSFKTGDIVSGTVNFHNPELASTETKGSLVENAEIEVVELIWDKDKRQDNRSSVDKFAVKPNIQNEIKWNWKTVKGGRFAFVFTAKDQWGKELKTEIIRFVQDENEKYAFAGLDILPDKRDYKVGESLNLLINSPGDDNNVLITVEDGTSILEKRVVQFNSTTNTIKINLEPKHSPNFFIRAITFKGGKYYTAEREIRVENPRKKINVAMKFDKAKYKPDEEAKYWLKATLADGSPAQAIFSLGVVDKALFYIQTPYNGGIYDFFYGSIRSNGISTLNSCVALPYPITDDSQKRVDYQYWPNGWFWNYYGGNYNYRNGGGRGGLGKDDFDGGSNEVSDMATSAGEMDARSEDKEEESKQAATGKSMKPPASPKMASRMMKKDEAGPRESRLEAEKTEQPRTKFADTAYWTPSIVTDSSGNASGSFEFPEDLTTWQAWVIGSSDMNAFGDNKSEVVTSKDLILRLQSPRFFTQKDEVTLSANVHNNHASGQRVDVELTIDKDIFEPLDNLIQSGDVPSGGEKRFDFRVKVKQAGQTKIKMMARCPVDTDGVEKGFMVKVHGAPKLIVNGGMIDTNNSGEIIFTLPDEIRKEDTSLMIEVNPSLACIVLGALPYLIYYPYGCTEQTVNRFVPAVIVKQILTEQGITLEGLKQDRDKMLSKHNPVFTLNDNPVFDEKTLDKVIKECIKRLDDHQKSNGSWGWWKDSAGSIYMTSIALDALMQAKPVLNNSKVDNMIEKGYSYLEAEIARLRKEYKDMHLNEYMVYVLSLQKRAPARDMEILWENRDKLNSYQKCLLAETFFNQADEKRAKILLENIENHLVKITENNTAYIQMREQYWWFWYNDEIETNAVYLRSLIKIKPDSDLIPMIAKWLIFNRTSTRWKSTKDTALSVLALSDYIRINKELDVDVTYTVTLNDKQIYNVHVNKDNIFTFQNTITLGPDDIGPGKNTIRFSKEGKGRLYFSGALGYFSLECPITAAKNEISVEREYNLLTPEKQTKKVNPYSEDTSEQLVYKKTPLKFDDVVKSGELVEVKIKIGALNNYEYLMFEDSKPAGFEAVELKSGGNYENSIYSHREFRDDRVVFFVDYMQQGKYELSYQLRAEIPGRFHALPTLASAMYAPKLRANSDEIVLKVKDAE